MREKIINKAIELVVVATCVTYLVSRHQSKQSLDGIDLLAVEAIGLIVFSYIKK